MTPTACVSAVAAAEAGAPVVERLTQHVSGQFLAPIGGQSAGRYLAAILTVCSSHRFSPSDGLRD
jgi:hypothetical protein